jgi:hypothetical protein
MASRKGIRLSKALARIDALTLRRIEDGKYPAKRKWLHDGGGLFLRVRPGSGGSWVCLPRIRSGNIDDEVHQESAL